jgi:hypothetical protein
LIAPDHRDRTNDWLFVLRKIDSAIIVLQNHLADQRRAQQRVERREARRRTAMRKQERLMRFLEGQRENGSN